MNHRHCKCPNIEHWMCSLAAAVFLKASTRLVNNCFVPQMLTCIDVWATAVLFSAMLKTWLLFAFRYLRDSVGHRDVGACGTGLQAQQPWHHSVHWGLQYLAEVGNVWREDKLSWPEAASEGWCGNAMWRTSLPRIQWDEPLQLSHLLRVQELSCCLLSQVSV